MKKIKDLVKTYPLNTEFQNVFDALSKKIFNTDELPEYRYSDRIDKRWPSINKFKDYKNDSYPHFDTYGKNEKYILNHITFTSKNILFLIGGIGVGKTTFINQFINVIQPSKHHSCENKCDFHNSGGFSIYIDFNLEKRQSFYTNDRGQIYADLAEILCIELRSILDDLIYDREYEIKEIWDEILKQKQVHRIFKSIKNSLKTKRVLKNELNQDEELGIRKEVYEFITKGYDNQLMYLCELLNFIIGERISNKCFFIIMDNIDIYSPRVQNIAKDIIVTHFGKSKAQVIVSVRQSTYCALFENSFARETADTVPQLGPIPSDIIVNRLDHFEKNTEEFLSSIRLENFSKKILIDNINHIKILINKNPAVNRFLNSICGNSIRKALIISRNLITNCVYDLTIHGSLSIAKIQRALMIGNLSSYSWSSENLIDNLYHVDNYHNNCYLTKMRILRLLATKEFPNGIEITRVIELLLAFRYSHNQIRHALNELMEESKRIIWSNTKLHFETIDELVEVKDGKLFISSAGIEYQSWLYHNLTYFQEVALDLYVKIEEVGDNYDYTDIIDRFTILRKLINVFYIQETDELDSFVSIFSYNKYKDYWLGTDLITTELLDSIKKSFDEIYSYKSDNNTLYAELEEFKEDFDSEYLSIKTESYNYLQELKIN